MYHVSQVQVSKFICVKALSDCGTNITTIHPPNYFTSKLYPLDNTFPFPSLAPSYHCSTFRLYESDTSRSLT